MGRKRKTTQQFIEDARKIHGDRYDYSKVEYIDVNTEVCIICPEHGEFWDTPVRHLRGNICPECKFEVFGGKNKRNILTTDKIDSVYVYKFEDNTVYVGRTLMRLQKKRHGQHRRDRVGKYAKEHHITMPQMEVIEDNLTLEEGLQREDYWVNWFKENGYNILNKAKTGIGYGSLGGLSYVELTYEACYQKAKKYKRKSEFKKKSAGAYYKAKVEGWLDEYTWLSTLKTKIKWSYERCYEEAKKYENRGDFFRGSKGAYDKARIEGWLDDYSWLSKEARQKNRWSYESCYEEAKKYENRSKFHDNNKGAYNAALRNGWLDDYSWFKPKPPQRPTGYWDVFENIKDESKKYKSRHAFHLGNYGAYKAARRNGWLDILFPLQK